MRKKSTTAFWKGDFGHRYIDRNVRNKEQTDEIAEKAFGVTRSEIFCRALNLSSARCILEIGCNVGQNFELIMAQTKDSRLFGVEINFRAAKTALQNHSYSSIVQAEAFNIPFAASSFDLVFTAGVLIHIHPDDLPIVIDEILRVSGRYVLGMEYHSDHLESVPYRGQEGLLWRNDFEQQYLTACPGATTLYSDVYEYSESFFGKKGLYYKVFLIDKGKTQREKCNILRDLSPSYCKKSV
jgi:pseudaminic acid biosynthesis-associated methylase